MKTTAERTNVKPEQILPTVLMAIDIGAGLVYLMRGNLRLFVYWLAAATLTACVTFGK